MTRSIRTRVLLAASLALAGFLGLTGIALDRAFRNSAESSVREYLQSQVYGLLAAAELTPDNSLALPQSLPEPRLSRTNSGLFAWVWDSSGKTVWKSPSTLGTGIAASSEPAPGEFSFRRDSTEAGQPVFVFNYSVVWETGGEDLPFIFSVAEDYILYQSRVNEFRQTLWSWLLGSVVVLVIVQLAVLMWILRPLRSIASEVNSIERGDRDRLGTDYPDELQSLALNLNALLANERKQRQRYRDKLDDLAHSLKTPLAVMHNLVERRPAKKGGKDSGSDTLEEVAAQVDRMQGIVSYQLRSAAGGHGEFYLAHPVKPEIEKVARSLSKAYYERGIDIEIEVSDDSKFRGDVGDFIEIAGNLMDNACKHCRSKVVVTVGPGGDNDDLILAVEDDGPGIPEPSRKKYLGRRVRGDTRVEGQGIGLAVVDNIAAEYGGSVSIDTAALGGARVVVSLPGAVRL